MHRQTLTTFEGTGVCAGLKNAYPPGGEIIGKPYTPHIRLTYLTFSGLRFVDIYEVGIVYGIWDR